MLRKLSLSVALAAALLASCKKRDEKPASASAAAERATSGAAATANATATATAAASAEVNWEKVERVPFAKLEALLPETLSGMKRTNLSGRTVPNGDHTFSEESGEYSGADEVTLTITVQDNPVGAADEMSSKTTVFKDYPVVNESESSDESDLNLIVGGRFIVAAHGNKLKVAQLKTALEAVDLPKLASWKLAGTSK